MNNSTKRQTPAQRVKSEYDELMENFALPDEDRVVITALNRKGGAGKTTMIQSLVSAAAHFGVSVLVVDLDPQRNTWSWAIRSGFDTGTDNEGQKDHSLFEKIKVRATDRSTDVQKLIDASPQSQIVLVDTPGTVGDWYVDILEFSDVLLTPVVLSPSDMETSQETFKFYEDVKNALIDPLNFPFHMAVCSRCKSDAASTKLQNQLSEEFSEKFPTVETPLMERPLVANIGKAGLWQDHMESCVRVQRHLFMEGLCEGADLLLEVADIAHAHMDLQRSHGLRD